MSDELTFIRAHTVHEAVTLLSAGHARVSAGGTDLAGSLQIDGGRTTRIVSIAGIDELQGIAILPDGTVRIGAMATLERVASSPLLTRPYLALPRAASCAGSDLLRHLATIGGNLCQRPRCWYLRSDTTCVRKGGTLCFAADGENTYHGILGGDLCHIVHPSDIAPALIALDARARIAGPAGVRTVPFDEFFLPPTRSLQRENVLGPADILTDVLLPPVHADSRSTYRRVSETGVDYPLASVAISVIAAAGIAEKTRIVLGSAAPVPWRARDAEAVLDGFQIDRMLIAEAVEAALADAMPLADNRYKIGLFKALLVDALEEIWELRPPGDGLGARG
jgi:xanthine dehydrogenase YagS FAD-binding subunit